MIKLLKEKDELIICEIALWTDNLSSKKKKENQVNEAWWYLEAMIYESRERKKRENDENGSSFSFCIEWQLSLHDRLSVNLEWFVS